VVEVLLVDVVGGNVVVDVEVVVGAAVVVEVLLVDVVVDVVGGNVVVDVDVDVDVEVDVEVLVVEVDVVDVVDVVVVVCGQGVWSCNIPLVVALHIPIPTKVTVHPALS
jgi:hypothetical protein